MKEHLGKWKITDNLREFPKELLKKLYDVNQNVLFGNSMTKGIVTYSYIPKEYTVNGNPLFVFSSIIYNGTGCDLEGKDVINSREELYEFFPENR